MPNVTQSLSFKVLGLDGVQKLNKALAQHDVHVNNITDAQIRFNSAGKAVQATVTGVDRNLKKHTVNITKVGGIWQKSAKDAKDAIDSISHATQSLSKTEAGRLEKTRIANAKYVRAKQDEIAKTQAVKKAMEDNGIATHNVTKRLEAFDKHGRLVQITLQGVDTALNKQEVILVKTSVGWRQLSASMVASSKQMEVQSKKLGQTEAARVALAMTTSRRFIENREREQQLAHKNEVNRRRQSEQEIKRHNQFLEASSRVRARNTFREAKAVSFLGDKTKTASDRMILSMNNVSRIAQATIVYRAISRLQLALIEGFRTIVDFNIAVGEMQAIATRSADSVGEWTAALRELSDQFGNPILDTAEAAYQAISNQVLKSAKDTYFLAEAQRLAVTTTSDLSTAVAASSSVLNAFNLDVSQSRRVNAELFKIVELGRVRLDEIADSMGRLSKLSQILGVSLEEQGAALATLTIQGIKADTSQTLLLNIYQKLIRPSERMRELFEELGVSSGQAAVSTFGFVGTMNKVLEAAREGGDELQELGELWQRIRATTGFVSLDQEKFAENMERSKTAILDYNGAFDSVMDNQGKRLQIEMNRMKNFFTVEFGQQMLSFIHEVGEGSNATGKAIELLTGEAGGLSEKMRALLQTVITGAKAFLAYKGVLFGLNAAVAFNSVTVNKAKLAMAGLTAAEIKAEVAAVRLKFALVSVARVALPLLIFKILDAIDEANNFTERITVAAETSASKMNAAADEMFENFQQRSAEAAVEFEQRVDRMFQVFFKFTADLRAHNTAAMVTLKKDYEKSAEDFGRVWEKLGDRIEDAFDKAIDKADELAKRGRDELKRAEDLRRDADVRAEHARIDRLPESERPKALEDAATRFRTAATANLGVDPDKSEKQLEVAQDFEEKAIDALVDKRDELMRKVDDTRLTDREKNEIAANRRVELDRTRIQEKKQRRLTRAGSPMAGPSLIEIIKHRQQLERAIELDKEGVILTEEQLKAKREIAELDELIADTRGAVVRRDADYVTALKKQGELDKEKGDREKAEHEERKARFEEVKRGLKELQAIKIDDEDALATFDERHAEIVDLGALGLEEDARMEIEARIAAQRDALVKQGQRVERQERLQTIQNDLSIQKDALTELEETRAAASSKEMQARAQFTKTVNAQLALYREFFAETRFSVGGVQSSNTPEAAKIKHRKELLEDVLPRIQQLNNQFVESGDPAVLEKIKNMMQIFTTMLDELSKMEKVQVEQKGFLGKDIKRDPSGDLIIGKEGDPLTAKPGELVLDETPRVMFMRLIESQLQLQEGLKDMAKADAAGNEIATTILKLEEAIKHPDFKEFEVPDTTLPNIEKNTADASRKLQSIVDNLIQLRVNRSQGGYLSQGGTPRGFDRTPFMGSSGEFVSNRSATRMFGPFLKAMNTYVPAANGAVSVGDITVNVSAAQNPGATGQSVVHYLRRAIRRGLVT